MKVWRETRSIYIFNSGEFEDYMQYPIIKLFSETDNKWYSFIQDCNSLFGRVRRDHYFCVDINWNMWIVSTKNIYDQCTGQYTDIQMKVSNL